MTKVYGGLFLEDLIKQDQYFHLQLKLFYQGLIQGIQLRVAHPSYTPALTTHELVKLISRLPANLELFIHYGGENVGCELGENFDECYVIRDKAPQGKLNWFSWNLETLNWGLEVAAICHHHLAAGFPAGAIHPGYGLNQDDQPSWERIIGQLWLADDGRRIGLETLMPIVRRDWEEQASGQPVDWPSDYWAFGGTPEDMVRLLNKLKAHWRCLIDFTHLIVLVNQANQLHHPALARYRDLATTIYTFLDLLHWPICHFSGCPNTLVDNHQFISRLAPEPLAEALRGMKAVCLELAFQPETAEQIIEQFREDYRLY